jgi:hypothetical protein
MIKDLVLAGADIY